ncbi:type II toxin-antitoxin system HipA family toxin [Pseudoduganella sp. LjRoot289]|uniref:type II toxin-antitoxin system HipA family toxin n=1 Tax=Pseudoduganella sp. LjRoot289 TaxID=3342314 RepID=UPI003ED02CA1
MNIKALGIHVGKVRAGVLFQYSPTDEMNREDRPVVTRFVADEAYAGDTRAPIVSISYLAATPAEQGILWRDVTATTFNGRYSNKNGWLLPAFFQNLLPEGVFRDHVAAARACSPTDHFEMLAACGKDLPGNIYALPVTLSHDELARYVTQHQDALEMTVTADPMEEGVSLSGVQPKIGVIEEQGRYVGRTKDHDTHIIAKLPVVGSPKLPELEHLSLSLAAAAGVNVCATYLEPLAKLAVQHGYDLGDDDAGSNFLAVVRYDRARGSRVHCEDFAQILGEMPEDKYGGLMRGTAPQTYLNIASVLMGFESLGEAAVHELLRRLAVNELLGNPDMHLKNIGLRYPDGRTPELPPAYDIVAYSAFNQNTGHALQIIPPGMAPHAGKKAEPGKPKPKQALSPALIRTFCAALQIPEKPAAKAISDCVRRAYETWPAMIAASWITQQQKQRLLQHFKAHPLVASLAKRARNK